MEKIKIKRKVEIKSAEADGIRLRAIFMPEKPLITIGEAPDKKPLDLIPNSLSYSQVIYCIQVDSPTPFKTIEEAERWIGDLDAEIKKLEPDKEEEFRMMYEREEDINRW